jgi:hypothetical protein
MKREEVLQQLSAYPLQMARKEQVDNERLLTLILQLRQSSIEVVRRKSVFSVLYFHNFGLDPRHC